MNGDIIGRRYMYNRSPLAPVAVVAVEGGAEDWAAYIAGLTTYADPLPAYYERVYREGIKLTEEEARAFFPHIDLEYRP